MTIATRQIDRAFLIDRRQPDTSHRLQLLVQSLGWFSLGLALGSTRNRWGRVAVATAAVAGVTLLDVLGGERRGRHVLETITIYRPPEDVYRFWRDFRNLPRFMEHLDSVQVIDDRRSHWKAREPAGSGAEWDAEIIGERPNVFISWRSLPGSDVDNVGTVRFRAAPPNRGTEVEVELRLFGKDPGQQVASDLRRLKQVLESGDVVRSDTSV